LTNICFATPPFNGKIFTGKDGRLEAYMVPPFAANHASFIEVLPNGDFVVAWFSGKQEGASNVAIVVSCLRHGSTQFTNATVASQRDGYSNQNPVLFYDNTTNILHMYHTQQGADKGESDSTIWHLQSTDSGKSWTTPEEVFSKPGSYDKNRIILSYKNGYWYFPTYNASGSNSDNYPTLSITEDNGKTWKVNTPWKDANYLVQPSIVRIKDSEDLVVFFRDRRSQNIYSSTSSDDGGSWSTPEKTSLPNNNAAIQAIHLYSGAICLVFDNSTSDRTPLTIALSYDNGKSWPYSRNLEPEPDDETFSSYPTSDVEYSYPSVVQDKSGDIHVVYTFDRLKIKYAQVNEDWIKGKSLNTNLIAAGK